MSTFEEMEASWLQHRVRRSNTTAPHKVTANALKEELNNLYERTADDRFREAIEAIGDNYLLEIDGSWKRQQDGYEGEHISATAVFPIVDGMLKRGKSMRLACATYVSDFVCSGTSFGAAVRQVERAYKRYLKVYSPHP